MCYKFTVKANEFLDRDINGYYHQLYTGFGNPENPEFINKLKNTFNGENYNELLAARDMVIKILRTDIPCIIDEEESDEWLLVCVPRAKSLKSYFDSQLMFMEAIKLVAEDTFGLSDGTDCIKRVVNTRTTHLRKPTTIINDGDYPYPGITIATCEIDKAKISGQRAILIDDIYTPSVNIDEDCIQALLDNGARQVVFYAIGYTRRD